MKGLILRKFAGGFDVLYNNKTINCNARGTIKQTDKLQTGDYVKLEKLETGEFVITELLPRKNQLIRPYISNLSQLVIVLSSVPSPDFLLVDKLLIGCIIHNIKPIIVINKHDINKKDFVTDVKNQYNKAVLKIIKTSAVTGYGLDELKQVLENNLTAFAGRSATGKTSLINAITGLNLRTDGVSKKINAGKNTTRDNQIFVLNNNTLIADTPGFNMLHFEEINPADLKHYYAEFEKYNNQCKFTSCEHINQPENNCAVLKAVNGGEVNKDRYDRYVKLHNQVLKAWNEKYD